MSAIEDVEVEISVVLGNSVMPINQLLKMGRGAVIDLDTVVDDNVRIYANDRLVAHADVMIVGEKLAVTIIESFTNPNERD